MQFKTQALNKRLKDYLILMERKRINKIINTFGERKGITK